MEEIIKILKHAVMITAFVFVMMLVIEYLNVLTQGKWHEKMAKNKWMQYVLAAFLGAMPGCLGAFLIVSMYSHRIVSFGALVTVMIATSGDEAFVMFAIMPEKAFLITALIFAVGIAAGIITDNLFGKFVNKVNGDTFQFHEWEECDCFPTGSILAQLKNCSLARGVLILTLLIFIGFLFSGTVGPSSWDWKKITILLLMAASLFITLTVPEHFLEEHLWEHIAKKHILQIFLWTFSAFIIIHFITNNLNLETIIKENSKIIMMIAGLVGIIPESGPHLFFLTLFSKGMVPFSIIVTNSIIQDGHGMLPLLGHSRRDFFVVKLINLIAGFAVGYTLMFLGY